MRRLWLILLFTCVLRFTASAHVLDQYLQVAQIEIAPDGVRVNLRLTPGAQVADRIIGMIDVDRDGRKDAVVFFRTGDTGIGCDDTEASLVGFTFGGTKISGSDGIVTFCARKAGP